MPILRLSVLLKTHVATAVQPCLRSIASTPTAKEKMRPYFQQATPEAVSEEAHPLARDQGPAKLAQPDSAVGTSLLPPPLSIFKPRRGPKRKAPTWKSRAPSQVFGKLTGWFPTSRLLGGFAAFAASILVFNSV